MQIQATIARASRLPATIAILAGVVSSTVLTLIVLPVLYYMTRSHSAAHENGPRPANDA